jgi:hypothetical protein
MYGNSIGDSIADTMVHLVRARVSRVPKADILEYPIESPCITQQLTNPL